MKSRRRSFSITFISDIYSFNQKFRTYCVKRVPKTKNLNFKSRKKVCLPWRMSFVWQICHPSFLWLSSLPARMKKIRSKCFLFFFQSVNINIVFRHSRLANSAARDGIGPKFKLIETSMDVLVTCKNEADQNKIEGARVLTIFLQFAQGQLPKHSPSNKAKFRTHLRFMVTSKEGSYLLPPYGHQSSDPIWPLT